MGICNFHKWLKINFENCFDSIKKNNVYDNIYIDVNFLLHNSMYKANNEQDFVSKLYGFLDLIFHNFIATRSIIFVIDGVAPYAKIILQRKRRIQMVKKINLESINSLHLTPGTELMMKLDFYLTNYINKIKKGLLFKDLNFIISPTTEHGEGEIKIVKNLIDINNKYPKCSHLLIGNDADIIVLTMSLQLINDIFVLIKMKNGFELLSIDKIVNKFSQDFYKSSLDRNINNRKDFAVLSIFAGNDYLPKLSSVKLDLLFDVYKTTFKDKNEFLITNNNFNLEFLKKYLLNLIFAIPKQFRKIKLETFNEKKIFSYLQGVLWCLNMYSSGKCSKYDYYYGDKSPSIVDILFFLEINQLNIDVPSSNTEPIPLYIYSIILLPKQAKFLINKTFQNIIDDAFKGVTDDTLCELCLKIQKNLSILHKQLRSLQKNSQNDLTIRQSISKYSIRLAKHKKKHKNIFSIKDIEKIIENVKNISNIKNIYNV